MKVRAGAPRQNLHKSNKIDEKLAFISICYVPLGNCGSDLKILSNALSPFPSFSLGCSWIQHLPSKNKTQLELFPHAECSYKIRIFSSRRNTNWPGCVFWMHTCVRRVHSKDELIIANKGNASNTCGEQYSVISDVSHYDNRKLSEIEILVVAAVVIVERPSFRCIDIPTETKQRNEHSLV